MGGAGTAINVNNRANRFRFIGYLLVGYIIFLPIQVQTGIGFRFAPSDICLTLILLFGISKLKLRATAWSMFHFGIVLTFAIGTYVALINNGYLSRYAIIQKDIGLITLFLGYVVFTTYVDSWTKLRKIMQIFLVSVVVQNFFALAVYVSGVEVAWMNNFYPRLSGMLVDPNAYGGLLVVAFAFHVVTCYEKRPLVSGLWGVLTTITLAGGIILSFSRSAWIGMVFVLLVVLIVRPLYAWRMLLALIGSLALILMYFGRNGFDVLLNMASRPSQIESRMDILYDAVGMFAEKPWFGVGLGTFSEQENIIVHNTPAWFSTEFGLFGGVILLGFMGWFVIKALFVYRKVSPTEKPLILGLLLAHVAMFGVSLGIEALYQRHWWLVFALIASPLTMLRQSESVTKGLAKNSINRTRSPISSSLQ